MARLLQIFALIVFVLIVVLSPATPASAERSKGCQVGNEDFVFGRFVFDVQSQFEIQVGQHTAEKMICGIEVGDTEYRLHPLHEVLTGKIKLQ